uniref:Prolyl 4-hydroxylase alpha-subunit N-terminal domain-containing protein n=1 Tax=Tetranychus urticae TaxID=32264 RepID=T1KSL2_TETUR
MKTAIGLLFLFAVINVSYSTSLREFTFMKSLYAREDMPRLVLTSMITRRIDQVKTLYESKSILEDAKIFCNSTEQSLNLLLESMNANDTQNGEFFESYSHIVQLIADVSNVMNLHYVDYLTVNSRDSFPRDELQAMMDAYISDIEMVRMCEVSMGRADRVDMKILELNEYFKKNNGPMFVAIQILVE